MKTHSDHIILGCDIVCMCFSQPVCKNLFQASMLSSPDGPFINLSRLNFSKYAARPNLAKSLFEYIFHHENDVRNVSELYLV